MQTYRHVFGPVMSGRLGRSLGLDLLGARTCSMNCVYCESGPLTTLTLKRAPYVPAAALLAELTAWEAARVAAGEPLPDVVTLGGLGEPTLNSDMPQIMAGARRILPNVPVAVLTNASLMTDPDVRAELAQADMILPSLDSLDPDEFASVNRGHPGLDPKAIAEGILQFRHSCETLVWLEILLVAGVNDTERNLELLAEYCKRLQPQRVDVTTLSRPGTEAWAKPVSPEVLARWRAALAAACGLGPRQSAQESKQQSATERGGLAGRVEKGQDQHSGIDGDERQRLAGRILASLERRPQTAAQLASALLATVPSVAEALTGLLRSGQVEELPLEASGDLASDAAQAFYRARG